MTQARSIPFCRPVHPTRIGIIGVGHVGACLAYTLIGNGLANEIVLIDKDRRRAAGEAMDLRHAIPFLDPVRVKAGEYADLAGVDLVVIAAGVSQMPSETRLELLRRNTDVFREILPQIQAYAPDALMLIATNPVDVLTHMACEIAGLPPERVIGSGTVLDSARLCALLSEELCVDARNVHAYILGEHGDSEVVAWSVAHIAGIPLSVWAAGHAVPMARLDAIFEETRRAAYDIIERKGATYYAVSTAMARLIEAILRDEHSVLPVSTRLTGEYGLSGITLSIPCVVGAKGVEEKIELPLSADEYAALHRSARVLHEAVRSL
jgi:L-lactate dehydrogenase